MILISQYQQVRSFFFMGEKKTFLFKVDGLYLNETKVTQFEKFWVARLFLDFLLFQEENGLGIHVYNIKEDRFFSIEGKFNFQFSIESGHDLLVKISDGNFVIFNESLQVIGRNHYGRFPKCIYKDKSLSFENGTLVATDIMHTDRKDILFDFRSNFLNRQIHLQSTIQVISDTVILFLSDMESNWSTFCVSCTSGALLKQTNLISSWFQTINNKIYSITEKSNGISIMDPSTFQIESIDLTEICQRESIIMDKKIFCVLEDIFYFSQNLGSDIAMVGAVSLKSKQIISTHKFEKGNGRIVDMKSHANNLYVLTEDSTLHFFAS